MENIILKNNLPAKSKSSYYWQGDSKNEAILHLGDMKKAIVIRKTISKKFIISEASFFPFPANYYCMRFDDIKSAKRIALKYLLKWFSETLNTITL